MSARVMTELVSILVMVMVLAVAVVLGAFLPLWVALLVTIVGGLVVVNFAGLWVNRELRKDLVRTLNRR